MEFKLKEGASARIESAGLEFYDLMGTDCATIWFSTEKALAGYWIDLTKLKRGWKIRCVAHAAFWGEKSDVCSLCGKIAEPGKPCGAFLGREEALLRGLMRHSRLRLQATLRLKPLAPDAGQLWSGW